MLQAGTTYRLVMDQVGSVRLVVNTTTGAVAQRVDYDEFGSVLADSAPGFQPFGFAGGLRDVDSGLTRFGARDYDSALGRWTAKDPLRFGGGLADLYSYVGSDPVNRRDPNGKNWWVWAAAAAACAGYDLYDFYKTQRDLARIEDEGNRIREEIRRLRSEHDQRPVNECRQGGYDPNDVQDLFDLQRIKELEVELENNALAYTKGQIMDYGWNAAVFFACIAAAVRSGA